MAIVQFSPFQNYYSHFSIWIQNEEKAICVDVIHEISASTSLQHTKQINTFAI